MTNGYTLRSRKTPQRCANSLEPDRTRGRCPVTESLPESKVCTKCGEEKSRSEFSPSKRTKDGLHSWCKGCKRAYMKARAPETKKQRAAYHKAYREANAEVLSAKHKVWTEANKEHLARKNKERYDEKREEILAQKKVYNAANRERFSERDRAYYEANKERITARQRAYHDQNKQAQLERNRQRRARLAGAEGSHTFEEIEQMYEDQGGICAYCLVSLFDTYHIDHIVPISRGGSDGWENLALTCVDCNQRKHLMSVIEFMDRLRCSA